MLSSATDNQFVSVSALSNIVAKRVDALGAFNSVNIDAAHADIASMIRSVFGPVLSNLPITIPDDFSSLVLFDLRSLPSPGGANDAASLLLTFLNGALMGLAGIDQTTGQFLEQVSNEIAAQPVLPVAGSEFADPSLESLATVMFVQVAATANAGGPPAQAVEALLAPSNLRELIDASFQAIVAIPTLFAEPGSSFDIVDDTALLSPVIRDVPVTTSDHQGVRRDAGFARCDRHRRARRALGTDAQPDALAHCHTDTRRQPGVRPDRIRQYRHCRAAKRRLFAVPGNIQRQRVVPAHLFRSGHGSQWKVDFV